VHVPEFVAEIVSNHAAGPPLANINQRSGVSVRLSITNRDARRQRVRRALRSGEMVLPRVSDLGALVASTAGKIEFKPRRRREQVLRAHRQASVLGCSGGPDPSG
jgi:hypothetical protein